MTAALAVAAKETMVAMKGVKCMLNDGGVLAGILCKGADLCLFMCNPLYSSCTFALVWHCERSAIGHTEQKAPVEKIAAEMHCDSYPNTRSME